MMPKKEIRAQANEARLALTADERKQKSNVISEKLINCPEAAAARCIFSYLATAEEVNLEVFHEWAAAAGKTVAFPVCGKYGHMEAYVPCSSAAMETDRFGIRSPIVSESRQVEPEEVDLVIVPVVAFDESLGRCGHGAGFYDRYLPRCADAKRIAVAFEAQKVDKCIMDEFDLPMDSIITEEKSYK